MTKTKQLEKAEAFYRTASAELVAILDEAIPNWLMAIAAARGVELAADDPLLDQIRATMVAHLDEAYADPISGDDSTSPGESVRNPLDILRRDVEPLNARLAELGAPVPERDEVQQQLFPNDTFGLAPAAFIDLGDAAHQAGLRWGAAKAHLHLVRHRPSPTARAFDDTDPVIVANSRDLMDQSRLRNLGVVERVTSAEEVAALDEDLGVVGAALDLTGANAESIARALHQRWPLVPIVGYGPHVDNERLIAADHYCSEVVPRSVLFSRVQRGRLTDRVAE